jgi:hypothetical protein
VHNMKLNAVIKRPCAFSGYDRKAKFCEHGDEHLGLHKQGRRDSRGQLSGRLGLQEIRGNIFHIS